ncbi:hypothetical protein ACHHYP_00596 [Achlya hypogyna]|uniref:Uncharacterized protein n=1 Tax=Achlya hypogyna TaxID=1202772 RepID=A0A1V9ZUB6_ACHHY|nr:hypothetical protein ACHHYP_00596 [Achlya hypogyna]
MAEKWNWAELVKVKSAPTDGAPPGPSPPPPTQTTAAAKTKPAAFAYTNISKPQPLATKKTKNQVATKHAALDSYVERNKFGFAHVAPGSALDMSSAEEFSQLRVKDRVITANEMREHMRGRTNVKLADLESKHLQRLEREEVDWVTIGVVTKANIMSTADGSKYTAWTISDLDNCIVSLFLYKDAYEAHWKESAGQLVAVINPAILPAREKGQFALKVTAAYEVAKIGTAMDFGFCQSYTQGGRQCKIAVNMAKSRYCVIHLAQRLKDAGKGRQELNSTTSFRNDMFKGGDTVRNVSSGSYAPETSKRTAVKRKPQGGPIATHVSSAGEVAVEAKKLKTVPKANFKPQTLDDLKASLAKEPSKASGRGQQSIVAKMLGIGAKTKSANLMQFMTKHQTPAATPTLTTAASLQPARPVKKPSLPSLPMRVMAAPPTGRAGNVASLRATGMVAVEFDTPAGSSLLQRKPHS